MARITGKNTKPELKVRRMLRALGIGYRLHASDLPGRPDIVMRKRRAAIEVRGCFWHRHAGCRSAYMPKSRVEFWTAKFTGTVERDHRNEYALADLGWKLLIIWECETGDEAALSARLSSFLGLGVPECART